MENIDTFQKKQQQNMVELPVACTIAIACDLWASHRTKTREASLRHPFASMLCQMLLIMKPS
jgi:hypothetical protein